MVKNNALVAEYFSEVKDTALERKLMSALDEAAYTYTETIVD